MSNFQCMFVSQRNNREKLFFMIYNPILGNTMQSINMSMLSFYILFLKKNLDPPLFRRHLNDITSDRTFIGSGNTPEQQIELKRCVL